MNTWDAVEPPELSEPGFLKKLGGALRVSLLVFVTVICVVIFLIGRGLRGILGKWVTFHFGIAWVWARLCLMLAGLRLRVSGRPISQGSLVANHSSWLDILALRSVRLIYFVSKAEVANWPGVGFITRITGTVFIERRRSHAKVQEQMLRDRMDDDELLCFFPEGTSTDGLQVLPFKSSLFSAFYDGGDGTTVPVQPVSVRYRPPQGADLPANFYGWWGSMGFEKHIWDVVTRSRNGQVDVIFHDPVTAKEFADRKQLADHCHRIVEAGVLKSAQLGAPEIARG